MESATFGSPDRHASSFLVHREIGGKLKTIDKRVVKIRLLKVALGNTQWYRDSSVLLTTAR
jgi:hypothetical protein